VADLPFLFPDVSAARGAMDGRLGQVLTAKLEAAMNYRILGYFESAFSQFSNRLRPIRTPADMHGMRIRVRPSKMQMRTFELLGAEPRFVDVSELIEGVKAGAVDAQENPFAITVTYGVHTSLPYRDEPLLPLPSHLLASGLIRFLAATAPGGNAGRGSRRNRSPTRTPCERR
jgi:TRAP-type C4-dicarboxylate transport system substrate-binding protein